jgi:hypothetical protein
MPSVRERIRGAGAWSDCSNLSSVPECRSRKAFVDVRHELHGTHEGARQGRAQEATTEAPSRTERRVSAHAPGTSGALGVGGWRPGAALPAPPAPSAPPAPPLLPYPTYVAGAPGFALIVFTICENGSMAPCTGTCRSTFNFRRAMLESTFSPHECLSHAES